ncbi:uncharacterized protein NEMAJ01_1511 [Nematocida major]|uniref:uncharacterized protein n=1 Tax=Nematocida major TaxID=1912982 RepID=UPI0020087CA6|nr:uncharacterized protein NEMAJ01_1511 [Nematocida major]KAH9386615.1 hypothetical protein NEMAJ01_1511 [Nematocida major]
MKVLKVSSEYRSITEISLYTLGMLFIFLPLIQNIIADRSQQKELLLCTGSCGRSESSATYVSNNRSSHAGRIESRVQERMASSSARPLQTFTELVQLEDQACEGSHAPRSSRSWFSGIAASISSISGLQVLIMLLGCLLLFIPHVIRYTAPESFSLSSTDSPFVESTVVELEKVLKRNRRTATKAEIDAATLAINNAKSCIKETDWDIYRDEHDRKHADAGIAVDIVPALPFCEE